MKLTINKLIIAIIVLALVVNLLVFLDINYFYIRTILAFLFLILVPGLLIMLILKIRNIIFWEYLVYTIGLSVAFIMFAGLLVNWTLPALHITDKPLSLLPILICFDIFLIIMGFFAYKRNLDLEYEPKFPKLDTTNRIFFIIPLFFPVLSILGALILNNFGPNILTMIMLASIAVYVFLVVLFRNKLNDNIYPWALFFIGLALLFSGWMRSWYLTGIDNSLEYYIYKLTSLNGFWSMKSFFSAYNAMLSLNVLPTVINIFSLNNVNSPLIFKLFIQIVVSFLPIILFAYFSKICNKTLAFLSVIFFLSLPMLYLGTSLGIRQEIAFIFFGLMLLVLFSKEIDISLKKVLFMIFGLSMIVSHYSTSYIALILFALTYLGTLIYRAWENRKIKKGKLKPENKSKFYLTGIVILLLLIFGFLWYIQITSTGEGATSFLKTAIKNMNNIFKADLQAGNQGIIGNLLVVGKQQDPQAILNDYINMSINNSQQDNFVKPSYASPYGPEISINNLSYFMVTLKYYIEFFGRLLVILGMFILIFYKKLEGVIADNSNLPTYKIVAALTLSLAVIFVIMPFFSISYDLSRFYDQIILICAPLIFFGFMALPKVNKRSALFYLIISLFLIFYFINITGLLLVFSNNPEVSMRFANYGREYNTNYIMGVEKSSVLWIQERNLVEIVADSKLASRRLLFISTTRPLKITSSSLIIPKTKDNIILIGYTNKFNNFIWISYKGYWMSLNFKIQVINDNKNKIYNNGGSEIFK